MFNKYYGARFMCVSLSHFRPYRSNSREFKSILIDLDVNHDDPLL